jgi:hypothetical protein
LLGVLKELYFFYNGVDDYKMVLISATEEVLRELEA